MAHYIDSDTTCSWCARIISKVLIRGLEDLEIREQVEAIQTKVLLRSARKLRRVLKTLGDFWRLAVSQTPEKTIS